MKTKLSLILAFSLAGTLALGAATVRIVQTNAAGDSVMLIDPVTNKVVGEIKGIEVNHGAAVAPDGSKFYITNEAESTLDVADAKPVPGELFARHLRQSLHSDQRGVQKTSRLVGIAFDLRPAREPRRDCRIAERSAHAAERHPRRIVLAELHLYFADGSAQ